LVDCTKKNLATLAWRSNCRCKVKYWTSMRKF
jgi:hypothetical protein